MGAFIHVFSKFTPELLFFEAALVFLLAAAYGSLWVLRRKRLGTEEITIKAGIVRDYLGALIADAHEMRRQLFALLNMEDPGALAGRGPSLTHLTIGIQSAPGAGAAPAAPMIMPDLSQIKANDPELAAKLAEIEKAMAAQAQALAAIQTEKARLEAELAAARATAGKTGAPAPAGNTKDLEDKIAQLEGRLSEYSVIEDDLANLKRLQQENAQLKAQLGAAGGAVATAAAAPEASAIADPTPAAAEEAPALDATPPPSAEAAPADPLAEMADLGALGDLASTAAPAAEATPVAEAAPAAAEPAAPVAAEAAAAPVEAPANDADLVAEFEKMLSS